MLAVVSDDKDSEALERVAEALGYEGIRFDERDLTTPESSIRVAVYNRACKERPLEVIDRLFDLYALVQEAKTQKASNSAPEPLKGGSEL